MPVLPRRARAALTALGVSALTAGLLVGPGVGTPAADAGTTSAATGAGTTSARATATAKPKTTVLTVLVVPAYWDKNIDDPAKLRATFGQANTFWSKQSGGRFRMSVTVLQPVKVHAGCDAVTDRAVRAAAAHGHHPSRYGLIAVLAPTCSKTDAVDHVSIGRSSSGQRLLTAYGSPRRSERSVVRVLGRAALGLGPSTRRLCQPTYRRIIDSSHAGTCFDARSDNDLDPLADGSCAGNLSAAGLGALGWLGPGGQQTLTTGSHTMTLKPLGSGGLRAVRIKIDSELSYWVEYRSKVGADAGQPSSFVQGVLIRRLERNPAGLDGNAYRPSLLVMRPSTQQPGPLLTGESWTSPQRVRVTVGPADARGVRITVRFRAPKLTAPAAVAVAITPGRSTIDVRWTRSADRGLPIDGYELSVLDQHGTELNRFQSQQVATRLERLLPPEPGQRYTVRVRAVTGAGRAPWASASFTRPRTTTPLVPVTTPRTGTTVTGRYLDLVATPVVDLTHESPSKVTFQNNFGYLATATRQRNGTWTARVDLSRVRGDGMEIWAESIGSDGRSTGSPSVLVMVPDHLAAPVIDQVSPDGPWSSGRLTVHVIPGVERLTGNPADGVVVRIGSVTRTADSAHDWTVTFDRSEIGPDWPGPLPSVIAAWSVYGPPGNTSETVTRPLAVR